MASSVPIVPVVLCGTGAYLIYCSFKALSPIGGIKNVLTGNSLSSATLSPKKPSPITQGNKQPGTNLPNDILPNLTGPPPTIGVPSSITGGSDPGPVTSI